VTCYLVKLSTTLGFGEEYSGGAGVDHNTSGQGLVVMEWLLWSGMLLLLH